MTRDETVDDNNDLPPDEKRRDFLGKGTIILAAAGAAAAGWPFVVSMNPSRDIRVKAVATVDLDVVRRGEVQTVEWQGRPVFVFHRTPEQIARMQSVMPEIDPEPDSERVIRPEYLVVVGICTHLGCIPNRGGPGWLCPCHGSLYDDSGRVVRGPAPTNLEVPPYRFENGSIVVGET